MFDREREIVQIVDEASDHDDNNSSESEFENDLESGNESDTEAYELRAGSVNSVLSRDTTIALYSASNSLELFYLCKVLDFGIVDENMVDDYKHLIPKGSKCKNASTIKNKKKVDLEYIINCLQRVHMYFPHKFYLL